MTVTWTFDTITAAWTFDTPAGAETWQTTGAATVDWSFVEDEQIRWVSQTTSRDALATLVAAAVADFDIPPEVIESAVIAYLEANPIDADAAIAEHNTDGTAHASIRAAAAAAASAAADVNTALNEHLEDTGDPHPQYLTEAEADSLYAAIDADIGTALPTLQHANPLDVLAAYNNEVGIIATEGFDGSNGQIAVEIGRTAHPWTSVGGGDDPFPLPTSITLGPDPDVYGMWYRIMVPGQTYASGVVAQFDMGSGGGAGVIVLVTDGDDVPIDGYGPNGWAWEGGGGTDEQTVTVVFAEPVWCENLTEFRVHIVVDSTTASNTISLTGLRVDGIQWFGGWDGRFIDHITEEGGDPHPQYVLEPDLDTRVELLDAAANAILLTSSLTPEPGDFVYWMWRTPGSTGASDVPVDNSDTPAMISVPDGWTVLWQFEWSGIYTNEVSQHALLMFPGDEWPTVYARVDESDGHFISVALPGFAKVAVGCGAAEFTDSTFAPTDASSGMAAFAFAATAASMGAARSRASFTPGEFLRSPWLCSVAAYSRTN